VTAGIVALESRWRTGSDRAESPVYKFDAELSLFDERSLRLGGAGELAAPSRVSAPRKYFM
jgi:hypothetical protein